MNATETMSSSTGGRAVRGVEVGGARLHAESCGAGPDVLLVAGLGDTVEAWTAQLDGLSHRYRLHAFDNRGAGRSPMLPDGHTVADMADDAAAVLRADGVRSAHVAGFSGGSAVAQEIALRHPDVVRSLLLVSTWGRWDAYSQAMINAWRWLPDGAPDERAMLEAFFLWIYTPRAHVDGTVAAIIDEALAFPYQQSAEAFQRQLEAWGRHDTLDRLPAISAPTMVVAGGRDLATPPHLGRAVAERIPGARFVLLPEEAHQPFQEVPEQFNALADDFWRSVDAG
jgi:pimeloyl-ACP methyl ester carboxylesterase